MIRVGIVGSRIYTDKRKIREFIFKLKTEMGIDNVIIVSGGQPKGADGYAKKFALELGFEYEEYPPAFYEHNIFCVLPAKCYGKPYDTSHYFARNGQIAKAIDVLAAFIPKGEELNSHGTMDTIHKTLDLDKKVVVIN